MTDAVPAEAQERARSARIVPRRMDFVFDDSIPRHWFFDDPVATAIANGVNLLFPDGERHFVRSVRHYVSQIDDPTLLAQIKSFAGQEGSHAREHERYFQWMRDQGYEIDGFLRVYRFIAFRIVERWMPASVNLAGTAAAEHFTAIMAENAFELGLFEQAHPRMRELLLWHAAEEIEHKSVAYDVLQKVAPSYAVRVAGMVMATVMMTGFWSAAALLLMRQDGLTLAQIRTRLRAIGARRPVGKMVFLKGIREFLQRDFHPWNHDNGHLARDYFASIDRAAA